jgi:pimeloyl-ACP methyl ester carboxylesterase
MDIIVDGHKAYAATGGKAFDAAKPTIVFVHGAGLDHTNWQLPARWFAWHGFNVIAPDLPGHGRSQGPQLETVPAMAQWVLRLLDAAGVETAALVGHSMGGAIVLEAAAAAPQRVTKLGLLGTGSATPVNDALITSARDNPAAAYALMTGWSLAASSKLGGNPVPGMWMTGGCLALLGRNTSGTLHKDFLACAAWTTGAAAVAKITCPTLVMVGANDVMTPPKIGQNLAQAIPGSRYVALPECGHMLFSESPDAMLDGLKAFFA